MLADASRNSWGETRTRDLTIMSGIQGGSNEPMDQGKTCKSSGSGLNPMQLGFWAWPFGHGVQKSRATHSGRSVYAGSTSSWCRMT